MIEPDRALKELILTKAYLAITNTIKDGREKYNREQKENKEYVVVERLLSVGSSKLFSIYETMFDDYGESLHEFFNDAFSRVDEVEGIEEVASVSGANKTDGKQSNISYGNTAKTTLLDHIQNIVDLIKQDYEAVDEYGNKRYPELTKQEYLHLNMLAFFHDLGKIDALMKKFKVGFDYNHEWRSYFWVKRIYTYFTVKHDKYDKYTRDNVERLLKNLKYIAQSKHNKTIGRFLKYDEAARELELIK